MDPTIATMPTHCVPPPSRRRMNFKTIAIHFPRVLRFQSPLITADAYACTPPRKPHRSSVFAISASKRSHLRLKVSLSIIVPRKSRLRRFMATMTVLQTVLQICGRDLARSILSSERWNMLMLMLKLMLMPSGFV